MSFARIRAEVDALKRKYATELEAYRLRAPALELCDEMTDAVTGGRSGPVQSVLDWTMDFFRRLIALGFHPRRFMALQSYLDRCLDQRTLPQVNEVLRALLPAAASKGLIPRSPEPVPF